MSDKWKAIARCATGTSHIDKGTPCQDYGDYKQCREYLIGAVSDGAGSRSLSEHGSKLAVKVTLKYLTEILENSRRTNPFASQPQSEEIFRELIDRVRDAISEAASVWSIQNEQKVSAGDFACTLLAFVVFPNGIAAMQLGDGFIVIRGYKDLDYDLLFPPSKGEYVNVTTFVTSPPEHLKRDLQIVYQLRRVSFVCASTDGLEKLALENDRAYPRFFIQLENYLQKSANPEQERDVEEFLNRDSVNKRTDDDKTLLLCVDIEADSAPQITETTPKSQPPAPLPPTTTPPPIISNVPKSGKTTSPPSVKTPQSPNQILTGAQTTPPLEVIGYESISNSNTPNRKREKKKSRTLIGLLLIANFLCIYFATVGAIYVVEKINQNRPDLEININNQFSLGSFPAWGIGAVIVILCFYILFTGLYASDDSPTSDNKNNGSPKKQGSLVFISLFKLNIGEVFAFCTPFAAVFLAFWTAFSLNNTFAVIHKSDSSKPKTETKQPASDKINPDVSKPNSLDKSKINKDTGSDSTSKDKSRDVDTSTPKDSSKTSGNEPKQSNEPRP